MKQYLTKNGPLAVPMVHLNGTSKESLIKGYEDAYLALREAEKALCAIAPHMRDYYTQDKGQWELADDQHVARLVKIGDIMHDMNTLAIAVMDQGN